MSIEKALHDATQIASRMYERKNRLDTLTKKYEQVSLKLKQSAELSNDIQYMETCANKHKVHSTRLLSLVREKSSMTKLEKRCESLKKLVAEYENSTNFLMEKYRSHVSQLLSENNYLIQKINELDMDLIANKKKVEFLSPYNVDENGDLVILKYGTEEGKKFFEKLLDSDTTLESFVLEKMYLDKIQDLEKVVKEAEKSDQEAVFYFKKVITQLRFENNNLRSILNDDKDMDKKVKSSKTIYCIKSPSKRKMNGKLIVSKRSSKSPHDKRRIDTKCKRQLLKEDKPLVKIHFAESNQIEQFKTTCEIEQTDIADRNIFQNQNTVANSKKFSVILANVNSEKNPSQPVVDSNKLIKSTILSNVESSDNLKITTNISRHYHSTKNHLVNVVKSKIRYLYQPKPNLNQKSHDGIFSSESIMSEFEGATCHENKEHLPDTIDTVKNNHSEIDEIIQQFDNIESFSDFKSLEKSESRKDSDEMEILKKCQSENIEYFEYKDVDDDLISPEPEKDANVSENSSSS
ncbi:hypothetical protein A3Q56_01343 [Intoshia linei]|uniref:Uncharacterized protein n=1 Tax=Intoshia linei TaxID=1819745 RepID=A0A177B9K9_9BILA|nr:hypothetical protein A3Q56_01343 [Intoshia linei]